MNDLMAMNKLLIITSTTGDGDLPMMGEEFWNELSRERTRPERYGI